MLQFAFMSPSPSEMLLLMLVALLLYGGDLPRVAKTWGKTLAEFRKNLSGLQNEFNEVIHSYDDSPRRIAYHEPTPVDAEATDAGTYSSVTYNPEPDLAPEAPTNAVAEAATESEQSAPSTTTT